MAARAAGTSRHSPPSIEDAGCGIKSPAHPDAPALGRRYRRDERGGRRDCGGGRECRV